MIVLKFLLKDLILIIKIKSLFEFNWLLLGRQLKSLTKCSKNIKV